MSQIQAQTSYKHLNPPPPASTFIDTEYIILENIHASVEQQIPLRQRDLAQIAGASLGMTNSILKRLAQKGWITAKKLNSRNIQYAITLEGINEIIHRSYRYFKRTIRNVVYLKDILEEVIYLAKKRNMQTVILLGASDLDFIVEHACLRWNIGFTRIPDQDEAGDNLPPGAFIVYAESIREENREAGQETGYKAGREATQNNFYLSRLIIKQAARAELSVHDSYGVS